jgi:hypothetical protein
MRSVTRSARKLSERKEEQQVRLLLAPTAR